MKREELWQGEGRGEKDHCKRKKASCAFKAQTVKHGFARIRKTPGCAGGAYCCPNQSLCVSGDGSRLLTGRRVFCVQNQNVLDKEMNSYYIDSGNYILLLLRKKV